jgi:UPF0755 protein
LSRGDRSRPGRERTPEERERDREERARRRAERAGGAGVDAAGIDAGIDPASVDPAGVDPAIMDVPARDPDIAPSQAPDAPEYPTFAEEELMPRGDEPQPEQPAPFAQEPAHPAQEPAPVAQEPAPAAQEAPPLAQDPLPASAIAPAGPEPEAALEHGPAGMASEDPATAAAQPPAEAHGEMLPSTASLEIQPSLPAAGVGPPQPPPGDAQAPGDRLRPGDRAPLPSWRVDAPTPLAGRTGDARRRRTPRSALARLGAVVALAAVIAAVVLLLHSLLHKSHAKTVAAPVVVKVLIPEGKTRLQIAQIAAADGLTGSYRGASKHSSLLNPTHYGAPRGTPDLEGFLFPATYDIDPHASVARLVEEQLSAFVENFGVAEIARARALHVTPYQLLTIASMIEREAQVPGDRPKIAAVIYNRLRRGMPLGIDATIYYAIELRKGIATYTSELTEAQLQIDSAYNTRTHTGLPPTPISNPGAASIEAAAHPAHAAYLYYVAAADGCGEHVFSTTLAAFEANAAAYHAALRKNGGHLPACHKK